MSKTYDIDHALADAISGALDALLNVPEVGKVYDQQHSDTQLQAYLALKDAAKEFSV